MYLVELLQGDRRHTVGLFAKKEEAIEWVESVPYVHKQVDVFDEHEFVNYSMNFDELPLYEEIIWKKSRFPLTKYMFTPDDGEIAVLIWDRLVPMHEVDGLTDDATQVDAYVIPNAEAARYIQSREEIREAIFKHYGKRAETGGVGSEDGEYITVENGPFIHLDALTVQQWDEKTSIEQFIELISQ